MTNPFPGIAAAICLLAAALQPAHAARANAGAGSEADTLELPFFDDFSRAQGLPDSSLWTSRGAAISFQMPENPPSTGALVLDALDQAGNFYPNARYGSPTPADTIESAPINLLYPGSKSVYLSFFCQRGGLGDPPEENDSLVLEFYSPTERQWSKVKAFTGGKIQPFRQEIIQISENKFLQNGFRLRFRNYISLGSQRAPDLVSNCDHWLIDYVYINKGRHEADTVFGDVALAAPPQVLIGGYQQVPWSHYCKAASKPDISYKINYRNNDSKARLLDSINLYLRHGDNVDKYALGTYNMPAYMDFENQNSSFRHILESENPDKAEYDIEVALVSDGLSSDYPANNSASIHKTLADCYAYDDGSAEAAYGIQGEGSSGGLAAVMFRPLTPDMIKGVYMYFCPVYGNKQADNFNLKIWDCQNGAPCNVIYTKRNVSVPKGDQEQWIFAQIDEPITVADTFFVGWEKNSNEMIAIGFDKNTTMANPKYYNIGGTWKQSKEQGQIMMRPAFGKIGTPVEIVRKPIVAKAAPIEVWPNPALDRISAQGIGKCARLLIISPSGKTAKSFTASDGEEIPIDGLAPGAYILYSPASRASAKFIKK